MELNDPVRVPACEDGSESRAAMAPATVAEVAGGANGEATMRLGFALIAAEIVRFAAVSGPFVGTWKKFIPGLLLRSVPELWRALTREAMEAARSSSEVICSSMLSAALSNPRNLPSKITAGCPFKVI